MFYLHVKEYLSNEYSVHKNLHDKTCQNHFLNFITGHPYYKTYEKPLVLYRKAIKISDSPVIKVAGDIYQSNLPPCLHTGR